MKRLIATALVGACLGVAAPAGASTHKVLERTRSGTLAICTAGVRNPKVIYGWYGMIGLMVVSDYILCDVPGVIYNDRVILYYENSIPIAEGAANGTITTLTPLGYYTDNGADVLCRNMNGTQWYGQDLVGVQWGIYHDTNKPDGYFSNTINAGVRDMTIFADLFTEADLPALERAEVALVDWYPSWSERQVRTVARVVALALREPAEIEARKAARRDAR